MPVASMGCLDTGQQADPRVSKLASWYPEPLLTSCQLPGFNTPHGASKLPVTTLLRMLHSPAAHDVMEALSYINRTLYMGRSSFANEVCTAGVVSSVMQHARSSSDISLRIPAFLVLNSIAKCGKTAGRSALAVAGAVDVALSALTEACNLPAWTGLAELTSARSSVHGSVTSTLSCHMERACQLTPAVTPVVTPTSTEQLQALRFPGHVCGSASKAAESATTVAESAHVGAESDAVEFDNLGGDGVDDIREEVASLLHSLIDVLVDPHSSSHACVNPSGSDDMDLACSSIAQTGAVIKQRPQQRPQQRLQQRPQQATQTPEMRFCAATHSNNETLESCTAPIDGSEDVQRVGASWTCPVGGSVHSMLIANNLQHKQFCKQPVELQRLVDSERDVMVGVPQPPAESSGQESTGAAAGLEKSVVRCMGVETLTQTSNNTTGSDNHRCEQEQTDGSDVSIDKQHFVTEQFDEVEHAWEDIQEQSTAARMPLICANSIRVPPCSSAVGVNGGVSRCQGIVSTWEEAASQMNTVPDSRVTEDVLQTYPDFSLPFTLGNTGKASHDHTESHTTAAESASVAHDKVAVRISDAAADLALEAVRMLGWMTVDASTVHRVCSPTAIHYLVAVLRYDPIFYVRPQVVKEAAAALRRASRNALVAARVVNEHGLLPALQRPLMCDSEYVLSEAVRLLEQLGHHAGVRHKIEAVIGTSLPTFTAALSDARPAARKLLVEKLQGQLPYHMMGAPLLFDGFLEGDFDESHALRVSTALALASAGDLGSFGGELLPMSLSVQTDELSVLSGNTADQQHTPHHPKPHRRQLSQLSESECMQENADSAAMGREFHPMDTWLTVPPSPLLSSATLQSQVTSTNSLPSPLWSGNTQDPRLSRSASSTNSPTNYMYPCHTSRSLPTPRGPALQSHPDRLDTQVEAAEQVPPPIPTCTASPAAAPAEVQHPQRLSCTGDAPISRCSSGRLPVLQERDSQESDAMDPTPVEPPPAITRHDIPPLPKLSCRTVINAASVYEARYQCGGIADGQSVATTSEPSSAVQSARTHPAEHTEDKMDSTPAAARTSADINSAVNRLCFNQRPSGNDMVELSTLTIGALRRELSLSTATARFSERTARSSGASRRSWSARSGRSGSMRMDDAELCPLSRSGMLTSLSAPLQPELVPWPADPHGWSLGLGPAASTRPNSDSSRSSWHSPTARRRDVSVSMNWLADSFTAASRSSSPLTQHRPSAILSSVNFTANSCNHSPCHIGCVLPPVQSFCTLGHFMDTMDDGTQLHTSHGGLLFTGQLLALGTEGELATLHSTMRSSAGRALGHAANGTTLPDTFRLPPRIKTKTWRPTPPPSPKMSEESPHPPGKFSQLHARLSALCYPRVWCGHDEPASSSVSAASSESCEDASSKESGAESEAESEMERRAGSARESQGGSKVLSEGRLSSTALLLKLRLKSMSGKGGLGARMSPTRSPTRSSGRSPTRSASRSPKRAMSEAGSSTRYSNWRRFLHRQQFQLYLKQLRSRKGQSTTSEMQQPIPV